MLFRSYDEFDTFMGSGSLPGTEVLLCLILGLLLAAIWLSIPFAIYIATKYIVLNIYMIFNRKDYDLKICFIDTLGLCYDGSTVFKRGLGGSESAMIFMARELAKIGFEVEVFNDCETDDCAPGEYDGVLYRPLQEVEKIGRAHV